MRRALRAVSSGAALLLTLVGPVVAQDACADTRGGVASAGAGALLSATVGFAAYDLAGGRRSDGLEAGAEGSVRAVGFHLRGGVHRVLLGGSPADPTLLRVRVSRALIDAGVLTVCGAALGGGSVVSSGEDRATTLGGGVAVTAGKRLVAGRVTITPYLGVRALGARASGDILGESFSASGGSLGGEGGVAARRGPLHGSVQVTADGFDPALGATAYPAVAVRFSLGWRF